jgi:hypothetical protein
MTSMLCPQCGRGMREQINGITINSINLDGCNICRDQETALANQWQPFLTKHNIQALHYMVHVNNLESILQRGILPFNAIVKHDLARVRIDLKPVQAVRGAKKPFGKTLHDYTPLYFCTRTSMQWVLCHKTRKRMQTLKPTKLIFIDIMPIPVFCIPGVCFTDGNAADHSTKFYTKPIELDKLNWRGMRLDPKEFRLDDEEWHRVKASEVLVPGGVPVKYFKKIICFSGALKFELVQKVKRYGVDIPVDTDSGLEYYFEEDLSEPD